MWMGEEEVRADVSLCLEAGSDRLCGCMWKHIPEPKALEMQN